MRVDHRERLIEEYGGHVAAYEASAKRDLLLRIGCKSASLAREIGGQLEDLRDFVHASADVCPGPSAVVQRKRQVVVDRHGVVDDRKLEYLSDVARLRRELGDIDTVKAHATARRRRETGNDVEQGCLAAARWPEQRIRPTILPAHCERCERPGAWLWRVRSHVRRYAMSIAHVLVRHPNEVDACHG